MIQAAVVAYQQRTFLQHGRRLIVICGRRDQWPVFHRGDNLFEIFDFAGTPQQNKPAVGFLQDKIT